MFLSLSSKKKSLVCLTLVVLSGCSASNSTVASGTSNQCPDKPAGSLSSDRVKSIDLDSETVKESALVSPSKDQGYAFKAKAGQQINYRTAQNICTWVFTPNNEIVNSTNLPVDGQYTMQIAALTGSTSFELEMNLAYPFSLSDFPKASCGDPLPSDPKNYPVTFYPVFVPYSEANLDKARSLFCQDALRIRRKDTQDVSVQISSFTSKEKSKSFANFINSEISDSEVGQPTVRTLD